MNFSYMKIAIYVLTFVTYAYSGYGSSTIAHLRDAIIAAEAIFGDVFSNLIIVCKKFRTFNEVFDAAVEETCIFTCPTEGGGPVHLLSASVLKEKIKYMAEYRRKKREQAQLLAQQQQLQRSTQQQEVDAQLQSQEARERSPGQPVPSIIEIFLLLRRDDPGYSIHSSSNTKVKFWTN